MPTANPLFTIVLAAGKGRRMRNRYMHKVCFDIAGVPTIVRTLDTFNRLGVAQNVVVVGEMAGQVVETVGERFSNVVFAYQPRALGTGDAARCGLQALAPAPDDARILVVAGDKIIDAALLARFLDRYAQDESDLQILASPSQWGGETAGRLLLDGNGRSIGIAELADIRLRASRQHVLQELMTATQSEIPRRQMLEWLAFDGHSSVALEQLFGEPDGALRAPLLTSENTISRSAAIERLRRIPIVFADSSGQEIPPNQALNAPLRNESVYLVRKRALEYGLEHMPEDNAQGELYLTDAIGAILRARSDTIWQYRVGHLESCSPYDVMSYNNPEELLRISDHFRGRQEQSLVQLRDRLGLTTVRNVAEWLVLFPGHDDAVVTTDAALADYYGDDPTLLRDRRRAYRRALQHFQNQFGVERNAIIVRSPGRINVMGRHIDHQGGRCNLMAVNQEVIMVVAPRDDDQIEVRNVAPDVFPNVSISLGSLVSQLNWDDWLSCINSAQLERHLRRSAGNWSIYIEAAMLRMQMAFRERVLHGMDMVVDGNIPVAAGMSSSSALVVCTAEAAAALHDLPVTPRQFVNFCGEGEWFVGTRGGSSDHAAMKYGAKGTINHVAFHEFELLEQIQFPDTHRMVVCNSFMQAKKAHGAKDAFNSRVASYRLGVELVRCAFPQYAALIDFVRDIDPERLHVPLTHIYQVLLALPPTMTASEVRQRFLDDTRAWPRLAEYFERVDGARIYPVRGVMWFGISECARARCAADCLRTGDLERLGLLMRVSHDGERCFTVDDSLRAVPFEIDISDATLQGLIDALDSPDPQAVAAAQLELQPGAYRCSIREIDAIVDIAGRTPGVLGAQIAGAGLGGCAMALVETDAVDDVADRLYQLFYKPNNLPTGVTACTPSAGSSLLTIPGG